MAIILLIKTEDGVVSELPILSKVTIGRSSASDYKVADLKMSGVHCSFEVNNQGKLIFTDMGSSNGSFINNSQISKTFVLVNDIVRIGNTLIKIQEKRLNSSERIAIGVAIPPKSPEKTLPDIKSLNAKTAEEEAAKALPKRRTVVLNKEHKLKKKVVSDWTKSDKVLDQEAPTGQTKFLKLLKKDKTTKKK